MYPGSTRERVLWVFSRRKRHSLQSYSKDYDLGGSGGAAPNRAGRVRRRRRSVTTAKIGHTKHVNARRGRVRPMDGIKHQCADAATNSGGDNWIDACGGIVSWILGHGRNQGVSVG